VSFVNPRRVPSMADAEAVAGAIRQRDDVRYTGLWLNQRGMLRALQTPLHTEGYVRTSGSDTFSLRNNGRNVEESLQEQRATLEFCIEHGIPLSGGIVTTAFGCNLEGEIPASRVVERVAQLLSLVEGYGLQLPMLRLADTVGWANPKSVATLLGAIRDKWPELRLGLHLHDTRGTAMANALVGLQFGIDTYDSSCAGLGGCPFAGHKGAAGNICTEDLAFMCEEMGIETGLDLDALAECARYAEELVGHPLPGKLMRGGTLTRWRAQ